VGLSSHALHSPLLRLASPLSPSDFPPSFKTASLNRILSFFLLSCILFLSSNLHLHLSLCSTMANVSEEYVTLGASLQELRKQQGHWDGAESNPAIDNFNGEKHQAMQVGPHLLLGHQTCFFYWIS